jgi:hypothetical protein
LAASELPAGDAELYWDAILASLRGAVRSRVEEAMQTGDIPYRSAFARRYFRQGRKEGRDEGRLVALRHAVLTVLGARGLAPTNAQRARIEASDSRRQLDRWLTRAAKASSVDEVLG